MLTWVQTWNKQKQTSAGKAAVWMFMIIIHILFMEMYTPWNYSKETNNNILDEITHNLF